MSDTNEYKDLVEVVRKEEEKRVDLIPLPKSDVEKLAKSAKLTTYFGNPIGKEFINTYILSRMDFPTDQSKLSQCLLEFSVRYDNIVNEAYEVKKMSIEIEELEIEIEETDEFLADEQSALMKKKYALRLERHRLDIANKKHGINRRKLNLHRQFNEAMAWQETAHDYLAKLGKASFDEIDWYHTRMGEMAGKIKIWGELQAKGMLEMTPSKHMAMDSNQLPFMVGMANGYEDMIKQGQIPHQHVSQAMEVIKEFGNKEIPELAPSKESLKLVE
jgi:hypothetical protein